MSLVVAFVFCFSLLSLLPPLCAGASMEVEPTVESPVGTHDLVMNDLVSTLRSIIQLNNWKRLVRFVKANQIESMEDEIFEAAAFYGVQDILEKLWSYRKKRSDLDEKHALVLAACSGKWETFQWLTKNCRCAVSDDCNYPLGVAISYGQAHLVYKILREYNIKSRAVDYSFINNAMLDNQYLTVLVLARFNWTLPLDHFDTVCADGYLEIVSILFNRQRGSITRKQIISALHCCTRKRSFDVIRFLLKRFSDQIDGAINDALEFAIERVCDNEHPDPSYMELVRILMYDGRAKLTSRMMKRALLRKIYHIPGLMQSGDPDYRLKRWLDFYEVPDMSCRDAVYPFETFESTLRWAILKGDAKLAKELLRRRTRNALRGVPSRAAWLNLMDHAAHLAQNTNMKQIIRMILEIISMRCSNCQREGQLPFPDIRQLETIHRSLWDLSQRYWKRDLMDLSYLLSRYSVHVLAMVGFLKNGLPVNEDVSSKILEEVLYVEVKKAL